MGGDGHGHGHHVSFKLPDYRIYKVEDVPELLAVQKKLAAKGLKDPWLRNEVWRYKGQEKLPIVRALIGRGIVPGFVAAVITTAVGYWMNRNDDHGHGHGKDSHGEHH